MRRTIRRTVTIVTTTRYTLCWEAAPARPPNSEPASAPEIIALPEPEAVTQAPAPKEFAKAIPDNELTTPPDPNSD